MKEEKTCLSAHWFQKAQCGSPRLLAMACILAFALQASGQAKTLGVAVKRGQQSVDAGILPLACITIATDDIALPLDAVVLFNLETHEKIKAIVSNTFDTRHPDLLTATLNGHRSLSMPILKLKPGHYRIVSLEFVGSSVITWVSDVVFNVENRGHFEFEIKPGFINYVGTFVISADWSHALTTEPLDKRAARRSNREKGFSCQFAIEDSAPRDAKWATDVVPGLLHLPSTASRIVEVDQLTGKKKESVTKVGKLAVRFTVNERGDVEDPWIVSSTDPNLSRAALEAVKKWHFRPAMKDGHPTKMTVEQPMEFQLGDDLSTAQPKLEAQ
jgi:TonB family protein